MIDANVWASGLIAKHPSSPAVTIIAACEDGVVTPIFSGELIDEVAYTLEALGADPDDALEAALLITAFGETLALKHFVMGCRDAEDDHLYELALIGSVQFIISRDHDVLRPPPHVFAYLTAHGIAITSPAEFVQTILNAAADRGSAETPRS